MSIFIFTLLCRCRVRGVAREAYVPWSRALHSAAIKVTAKAQFTFDLSFVLPQGLQLPTGDFLEGTTSKRPNTPSSGAPSMSMA